VLLPLLRLGTPGEPVSVDDTSLAAARRAFKAMYQPQQQRQQPAAPTSAAPTSETQQTIRGSSSSSSSIELHNSPAKPAEPLLVHVAKRTDAGLMEYLAVIVNISVEMPAPGCLHVVLQSLGGDPQQFLTNCTPEAISYRQATPTAAWQLLPPFSGAALVLLQPVAPTSSSSSGDTVLPGCAEVELRDVDPQTSGSALCSLDTDSSGVAVAAARGSGSSGDVDGGKGRGLELPAVFSLGGGKFQALAQVHCLSVCASV
jgi:hypothetical protein